jgi:diguanylate cyclase (GGDEF)-like protein/PAS domain S-box-containing protein
MIEWGKVVMIKDGFEALWIAAGLIGYWELVVHLQRTPCLQSSPRWLWTVANAMLPLFALAIWCWIAPGPVLELFLTFGTAAMVLHIADSRADRMIGIVFALEESVIVFLVSGQIGIAAVVGCALLVGFIWSRYQKRGWTSLVVSGVGTGLVCIVEPRMTGAVYVLQWLSTALPFWLYIREQQERVQLLKERLVDPLTGVLNRRGFASWMAEQGGKFGVLTIVDLDDFKRVNDTFGHEAGDAVLQEVAKRLQESVRETDAIVRFGGDEFICALPMDTSCLDDCKKIVERIYKRLVQEPVQIPNGNRLQIQASIGAAKGELGEVLERYADRMLLRAKREGKRQICWYDQDTQVVLEERSPLSWVMDAIRPLVGHAPQGFVLTDREHRIVEVNAAFESITGYTKKELVGKKPRVLAAPGGMNDHIYPEMYSSLENHGFWRGRFLNARPDGSIWVAEETITTVVVGGEVVGYWGWVAEKETID